MMPAARGMGSGWEEVVPYRRAGPVRPFSDRGTVNRAVGGRLVSSPD